MRTVWTSWAWRTEPDAPGGWTDLEQRVVLVEGLHGALRDGVHERASSSMHDAERKGCVFVCVDTPESLATLAEDVAAPGCYIPERIIPALRIERIGGISTEDLHALCRVPAKHRAIVARPREGLAIGLLGTVPKSWGAGYRPVAGLIDMVIVQGPTGPDAWPMHRIWVRDLRDECVGAAAFAFMGWGEWAPRASVSIWQDGGARSPEERGVAMLSDGRILLEDEAADVIRARHRAAGHHVHSPAIVRDASGLACLHAAWRREEKTRRPAPPPYDDLCWLYRVGAARSGRVVWERSEERGNHAGREHLELPEGL